MKKTGVPATTIQLKKLIPEGMPEKKHFEFVESDPPTSCSDGEILVQLLWISADPYMRGRMKVKSSDGYSEGKPLSGFVAGEVIKSKDEKWKVGTLFGASLPFITVQAVNPSKILIWPLKGLPKEQLSYALGILGMPGSTAYAGLIDVLKCEKGQTVWVSGAGGAVGSLVGQIAKKLYNCTVIGSAGGPEKCAMVKDKFGFDACVDYKLAGGSAKKLEELVREVAPEGIDMYFENVGGIHFTAATKLLRPHGRIAICGAISKYNDKTTSADALDITGMIYNFQRIEGFVCFPWLTGAKGNFHADMGKWVKEHDFVAEETHFDGVQEWVAGFQSLFTGGNKGKVCVSVEPSLAVEE